LFGCAVSSLGRFLPKAGEVRKRYLRVNGLPGGESQRGQEHAVEAGDARRRVRRRPARPARQGESWIT
jgi:hypothetical protein